MVVGVGPETKERVLERIAVERERAEKAPKQRYRKIV